MNSRFKVKTDTLPMKVMGPVAAVLIGVLLLPLSASVAETIEGKMNGLHCAQEGIICPFDDLDAVIALESDFVVTQPDGTFYAIPNMDRAVKARYILQNVRVTGKVHPRYKSITAETFEVEKEDGSGFRTAWSPDLQRRVYWDLKLPGATRP
jgi:hypothetical protein